MRPRIEEPTTDDVILTPLVRREAPRIERVLGGAGSIATGSFVLFRRDLPSVTGSCSGSGDGPFTLMGLTLLDPGLDGRVTGAEAGSVFFHLVSARRFAVERFETGVLVKDGSDNI